MIQDVFEETSTWAELPHKFEAGTPAIAEAIGLAEAINYINNIGLKEIHEYEKSITKYLFEKLKQIENIEIIGPSPEIDPDRASLATFYIKIYIQMILLKFLIQKEFASEVVTIAVNLFTDTLELNQQLESA